MFQILWVGEATGRWKISDLFWSNGLIRQQTGGTKWPLAKNLSCCLGMIVVQNSNPKLPQTLETWTICINRISANPRRPSEQDSLADLWNRRDEVRFLYKSWVMFEAGWNPKEWSWIHVIHTIKHAKSLSFYSCFSMLKRPWNQKLNGEKGWKRLLCRQHRLLPKQKQARPATYCFCFSSKKGRKNKT